MPATATAETPEPSAIEAEIEAVESRRAKLRERREAVKSDLQDARTALKAADSEEDTEEALEKAERLQVQHDTLTEAIEEQSVEIESLRERLKDARAARRREEKLEALAEKGREAVEARTAYDAVRDEILEFLREKAPELARRFSEWRDAADTFRTALVREETHVQHRPSSTTAEDEERAEALISELKDRGVTPFKNALAPHYAGDARRWKGWSHEAGYDGPSGRLRKVVDSIRKFGNQSAESSE